MGYPSEDEIIDLDELNNPWDQHPEETNKAYQCFQAYKDLGRDRNKLKAYLAYKDITKEEHGKNAPPSHVYSWSKEYRWDERADAWDSHLDEKREEKYEEEMLEYSKDMAKNAQIVGNATLQALKHKFEDKSPEEIAKLIFEEDNMGLEDISRTLATSKNFAQEAFGRLTEDDDSRDEGDIFGIIKELD